MIGTLPLKVMSDPMVCAVPLLPPRRKVAPSLRLIAFVMLRVPLFLAIMSVALLFTVMEPVPPTVTKVDEPALNLSQP